MECLLAMALLSVAMLGVSYLGVAGQQHMNHSEQTFRAVRLAEHLMEEIASRPYGGSGSGRSGWHLDDYAGFEELAGNLRDFTGESYGQADQVFSRQVSIAPSSTTVAELGGIVLAGKQVTIRVTHPQGNQWQIERFIPEPVTP